MRGSDKRMLTSAGSDEESDPRMGLMARPQKKSPDKGMNVLERAERALRRSTRNPAQNLAEDFEYFPHRKPKSKATQRTESLGVNELQGTQASAGNSEREEPSTLIMTSAKTAKNLGKSKAIGRKDAISPSPQGMAAKLDVALPPRAPKGRREALESQKQLSIRTKGGTKNKSVNVHAPQAYEPPSSPSSSSSDDASSSSRRSRGRDGRDDSDDSEGEEDKGEDEGKDK